MPALLLFIAGAWAYFRLTSPIGRVLAPAGALPAMALLSTWSYATRDYRADYRLPKAEAESS